MNYGSDWFICCNHANLILVTFSVIGYLIEHSCSRSYFFKIACKESIYQSKRIDVRALYNFDAWSTALKER